jgi:hypothetical protein
LYQERLGLAVRKKQNKSLLSCKIWRKTWRLCSAKPEGSVPACPPICCAQKVDLTFVVCHDGALAKSVHQGKSSAKKESQFAFF